MAKGPPVGGVQGVEVHVHRHTPGAADAGHQDDFVLGETSPVDGPDQRPQDNAVAAPRTPDVGEFFLVAQILVNKFGDFGHGLALRVSG